MKQVFNFISIKIIYLCEKINTMIQVITIDDSNKSNNILLELVNELSKKNKGILLGAKAMEAIDEVEDERLVKKMKIAMKGGLANKKEKAAFLKRMGIKNED